MPGIACAWSEEWTAVWQTAAVGRSLCFSCSSVAIWCKAGTGRLAAAGAAEAAALETCCCRAASVLYEGWTVVWQPSIQLNVFSARMVQWRSWCQTACRYWCRGRNCRTASAGMMCCNDTSTTKRSPTSSICPASCTRSLQVSSLSCTTKGAQLQMRALLTMTPHC